MQRTPPRHLAQPIRPRALARDHVLAESLLAMIAIALTTALVIGSMTGRSSTGTVARLPNVPPMPPQTTARAAAAVGNPAPVPTLPAGNVLGDSGFEAGLAGWAPVGGARLSRVDTPKSGLWAAGFVGGGGGSPGIARRDVTTMAKDKTYVATVWVRASRPGVTIQVNVPEYSHGTRYATDTAGAVLGTGWERVEVAHTVHEPGSSLSIEIVAPGLPDGTSVLVDDLAVVPRKGSFMSIGGK